MSLDGKVAAVTGAGSGAGEAAALALAAQGAAVALAGRRAGVLNALAARIEDDGGTALALPTEAADQRQARAFVEHAYERFGRLDLLVCAAAACAAGPLADASMEAWRQMTRISLLGVVYCCHAALPVMRAQGFGEIVVVLPAEPGLARGALTG